jgi:hypothetical protein
MLLNICLRWPKILTLRFKARAVSQRRLVHQCKKNQALPENKNFGI